MLLLKSFIQFLKRPTIETEIGVINVQSFLKTGLNVVLVLILFDLLIGLLIVPFKLLGVVPVPKEFEYTFYNTIRIILILPIIEELIFRLPLKITKHNLIICISMITLIIGYKLNILLTIIICLLIILLGTILIEKDGRLIQQILTFFKSHFIYILYFQAIVFGGLHLLNYDLSIKTLLVSSVMVFSQILSGLFLGFIRVRYSYGIFICILSHIIVNSLYSIILS